MNNLHFYLDGKSCLLRAKKLLSNCYHLCFEDDYSRNKLGSYMDVILDEQGNVARGLNDTNQHDLIPDTNPEQEQQIREIWNTIKRYLLPETCLSAG